MPSATTSAPVDRVSAFLAALVEKGFCGDIAQDDATRLSAATDNSIYQTPPAAVVFPRHAQDVTLIMREAAQGRYAPISVTPRGGGTGTNGQALTEGVVIDLSRHLNRITDFNAEAGWVTVEPGVVLDQLNTFLAPHGWHFPPHISTSSRATLGGMVATDASGKGSRVYGKTSDYIEALAVVVGDGTAFVARQLTPEQAQTLRTQPSRIGVIVDQVLASTRSHRALIDTIFPRMNRGLTGYNLQSAWDETSGLALHKLLAGSEGTLAITTSITLRLAKKPRLRALGIVRYDDFEGGLEHVQDLIDADPLAVEILDDKILALARSDILWSALDAVLGKAAQRPVKALNFVEFVADDEFELASRVTRFATQMATSSPASVVDWAVVEQDAAIEALWGLRKKAVGLAGKLPGRRKGVAFVEDTAVPPERLVAFVRAFRQILDRHDLTYAMFGHADVGCLHVRPALDMTDNGDVRKVREISDAVAALAKEHGGLLWGEHGRGYRSEYTPLFFGPVLYRELCKIKAAFDPQNLLNPGKLVAPLDGAVTKIDEPVMRGSLDAQITASALAGYEKALACNGNGACFSWDAREAMCPSYKATRDRVQSPKGRAALLREWARRRAVTRGKVDSGLAAFERQVHDSLATCLSCKACASSCPVQVDIPTMRARFMAHYYRARRRPARDWVIALLEPMAIILRRVPRLSNALLFSPFVQRVTRWLGLINLPAVDAGWRAPKPIDLARLSALPDDLKAWTVILAPDTFTATFDLEAIDTTRTLLERLGYTVHLAPAPQNGKALHSLGFLRAFSWIAAAARKRQRAYRATGVAVVGVEPATTYMDRPEYSEDASPLPETLTLDEFLHRELEAGRIRRNTTAMTQTMTLALHCTERSLQPQATDRWRDIFAAFGIALTTPKMGCCGMAGLFGHLKEHSNMSRRLFDMSWREVAVTAKGSLYATGFSCRCQVEIMGAGHALPPAAGLLTALDRHAVPPVS